jgi:hypothetical protein
VWLACNADNITAISEHKRKTVSVLNKQKTELSNGNFSNNKMSRKRNQSIVPLHYRLIPVLVTCWFKKVNLFLIGNMLLVTYLINSETNPKN